MSEDPYPGLEESNENLRVDPAGAAPWAWRFPHGPTGVMEPIGDEFFLPAPEIVARELLGKVLRSQVGNVAVEGVIVEVEAYLGTRDPASHAATRRGMTARNASMFGPPGRAYVYRSYGIHWCLNVVTGPTGSPSAVLIRAIDPILGAEEMSRRRGGRLPLCAGPGRMGQALGITRDLDGHDLRKEPLLLLEGWSLPDADVMVSGRIGVKKAAEWPLRFYLEGHPQVSKGPHTGPGVPFSRSERSLHGHA